MRLSIQEDLFNAPDLLFVRRQLADRVEAHKHDYDEPHVLRSSRRAHRRAYHAQLKGLLSTADNWDELDT